MNAETEQLKGGMMPDLPEKRGIRILNVVTFLAVIAIGGFLFMDGMDKLDPKYKYVVESPVGKGYSVEPPALFGSNCIKFQNEDAKLVVICGPYIVRQL